MAYLARMSSENKTNVPQNKLLQPRLNFFTWFHIWQVPSLTLFFNIAKCDENWELDSSLTHSMFSPVLERNEPEWLILFPEVNIWTENDALLQSKQSQKYYLPSFRNLLYPRFSAFANAIEALRTKDNSTFAKIYDVSILYYHVNMTGSERKTSNEDVVYVEDSFKPPSLLDIFASDNRYIVEVHVSLKSISRVPRRRNKLEKWLEKVWCEKDKTIDDMSKSSDVTFLDYKTNELKLKKTET